LLLFLLFSADFIANKGLSGARKRSAEDSDAEEDSEDEDGISLGSDDTPDAFTTMGKDPKKPTSNPLKPKASKASTTKMGNSEVDNLIAFMSSMKVTDNTEQYAADFSGHFPWFYFTFSQDDCNFVRIDFLVPTVLQKDITPVVSQDGEYLLLTCKIPEDFLNVGRLIGYYTDPRTGNIMINLETGCFEAGKQALSAIKNQMMEKGMFVKQAVKLPWKALNRFWDPNYLPTGGQVRNVGTRLTTCRHEDSNAIDDERFWVVTVVLQKSKLLHTRPSVEKADTVTADDIMRRYRG
jgi:hypothetical protein